MKIDIRTMQAFVDTLVGIEKFSYPAKKNAPRPETAFAHIQLLEEYQESIPTQVIKEQTDETTTYRTRSLARLRFRIVLINDEGANSPKIMHGWTREDIKTLMISTGYGFIDIKPISLEDAKLESQWEDRQGMSLEMYVTRVFEETVDNITSLQISGEFVDDALESVLLTISINE